MLAGCDIKRNDELSIEEGEKLRHLFFSLAFSFQTSHGSIAILKTLLIGCLSIFPSVVTTTICPP